MKIRGWLMGIVWVVLCSTSLAILNRYADKVASSDVKKNSGSDANNYRNSRALLFARDDGTFVNLFPVHQLLDSSTRNCAIGKGRFGRRCFSYKIIELQMYFESIPFEESLEERNQHIKCMLRLYPFTTQLIAMFTLKQRRRMKINYRKLLIIENLLVLLKCRALNPEEMALLIEALRTLDHSPERLLLNFNFQVTETPEEAPNTEDLTL
jgi:hypothetical protein